MVTVPHEISYPEHAYVYVTGGSNHDGCAVAGVEFVCNGGIN